MLMGECYRLCMLQLVATPNLTNLHEDGGFFSHPRAGRAGSSGEWCSQKPTTERPVFGSLRVNQIDHGGRCLFIFSEFKCGYFGHLLSMSLM